MRLLEFASADDLVKLWQIVSQNVFAAVEKERREAEEAQRLEASKPKRSRAVRSPSRSVSAVKAVPPKTVRLKSAKPQVAKPQASKTQATPQSMSKQQTPLMTQVARSQTQLQPRNQQPIMSRTSTVQPTRRTPQVTQPISQQQQIAQINRKIYPNMQRY
jgi:hypothetical protein